MGLPVGSPLFLHLSKWQKLYFSYVKIYVDFF